MFVALFAGFAAAQSPPVPAPCSMLQPTFTVDGKEMAAGSMFPLKVGEQTVLVTAFHLFGPVGGLAAPIPAADLPAKVTNLIARDAASPRTECARSSRVLPLPDAAPMGGGNDGAKDVAVFAPTVAAGLDRLHAVAPVALAPRVLATAAPRVGDPVWLASKVAGKEGAAWSAKLVEVTPGFLFFEYVDRDLDLAGTNGAALIDATGAVVGLNLGGGKMEDGALIGSASPAAAVLARVSAALKSP